MGHCFKSRPSSHKSSLTCDAAGLEPHFWTEFYLDSSRLRGIMNGPLAAPSDGSETIGGPLAQALWPLLGHATGRCVCLDGS